MELAVFAMFGLGAWWGVFLGDSDDELELLASNDGRGRRRVVVDVTVDRRHRAHEAMVDIPKPGYLIVKADVVKGLAASDELLQMTPAVRDAWTRRVVAFRKGGVKAIAEADIETRSIFDDLNDLVKSLGEKKKKKKKKKAFDYGALVLDDEEDGGGGSGHGGDGGGGGGGGPSSREASRAAAVAAALARGDDPERDDKEVDEATKVEGACAICFDQAPTFRACFLPCGHASMCYGCALDTAISLSGACPLCRTRAAAIVTYDRLELVRLPSAELGGLRNPRTSRAVAKGAPMVRKKTGGASASAAAAAEEEENEAEAEQFQALKVEEADVDEEEVRSEIGPETISEQVREAGDNEGALVEGLEDKEGGNEAQAMVGEQQRGEMHPDALLSEPTATTSGVESGEGNDREAAAAAAAAAPPPSGRRPFKLSGKDEVRCMACNLMFPTDESADHICAADSSSSSPSSNTSAAATTSGVSAEETPRAEALRLNAALLLELPFGGDLQRAMKSQDRDAIRVIAKHQKQAALALDAATALELEQEQERQQRQHNEGASQWGDGRGGEAAASAGGGGGGGGCGSVGDFTAMESLLERSRGALSVAEASAEAHEKGVEAEWCWVARVNGPRGNILDSLTDDDLLRTKCGRQGV